ncbi:MAG: flagellin [Alphaproteobacteria bacterium]|nr:flagellin [Alphaproteobacteria bacterium]
MPVISTNTAANSALYYLNSNSAAESNTLAKLASGSNITKASDDAAGLAIGTLLESDVTALNQASTNSSQANSILQIADGGLSNISDILQRMKALASEADSGSVTDTQRSSDINAEYSQLVTEINSIATDTKYNGQSLLDGTSQFASGVAFMVGTSSSDTISVTISSATATALGVNSTDVSTQADAVTALAAINSAIDVISSQRASIGASESRFNFQSEDISTMNTDTTSAESAIMDTDVAAQKAKLSSEDVKSQAAMAALAQADNMPKELLTLLQS